MILTFNAVNDAPIQTLPTEAIVVEDTPTHSLKLITMLSL